MQTKLSCIKPGKRAVVLQINTGDVLKRRMQKFGLVSGTEVCCRYRSPSGTVTALQFKGIVIALRTRDLQNIQVVC